MPDMLRVFGLLLPALIPSWAFFKAVEPSPRVQWRVFDSDAATQAQWQEFRPRPKTLSFWEIAKRLFWNPRWNETLYMVSLAERLTLNPTPHSLAEIQRLLAAETGARGIELQFRLLFVQRDGNTLKETETFRSDPWRTAGPAP